MEMNNHDYRQELSDLDNKNRMRNLDDGDEVSPVLAEYVLAGLQAPSSSSPLFLALLLPILVQTVIIHIRRSKERTIFFKEMWYRYLRFWRQFVLWYDPRFQTKLLFKSLNGAREMSHTRNCREVTTYRYTTV